MRLSGMYEQLYCMFRTLYITLLLDIIIAAKFHYRRGLHYLEECSDTARYLKNVCLSQMLPFGWLIFLLF